MTTPISAETLPAPVARAVTAYLELVDAAAPGLVEGLYLTGSLGFDGEWHEARSDVDFTAVLAERPDGATAALLGEVIASLGARHPKPCFDGFHIARADLLNPPEEAPGTPSVLEWAFEPAGRLGIGPVTWHELARHSIAVRGPRLTEADVWTDDAALRAYTYANLSDYWQVRLGELRAARDRVLAGDPARTEWITDWFVLGVPRLHHLLATGALTGKDGAGRHALAVFDERWHPIVREALRLRAGEPSDEDPARRLDDTLAFTAMALDAALALGA